MSDGLTAAAIDRIHELGGAADVVQAVDRDALVALVSPPEWTVEVIDTERDPRFTGVPERKTGQAVVWDAASLNALWTKYADPVGSEVYADVEAFTIKAVFDGHPSVDADTSDAGWYEHTATLNVRKTVQWRAWEARDGVMLDQSSFAEHVEDRLVDFVNPEGATMYELAQTFIATTSADFEASQILSSSQRRLVYKETIAAKAGQKGDIEIPATFTLGLKPFEGSPSYSVVARLRYRISNGNLSIGYKLERPEDVLQAAFGDVVGVVEDHVAPTPVLRGRP